MAGSTRGPAKGQRFGGRKAGTPNKATVERRLRAAAGVQEALDTGIMPLTLIIGVMRGTHKCTELQFEAAKVALNYVHPRLNAIAHGNLDDMEEWTDHELRAEIERIEREKFASAPSDDSAEQGDPPQLA